jgi:5'-nucleotidase
MRRFVLFTFLIFLFGFISAKEVRITLFQLNDVYEMTPVNGGKRGGLARVSTLLKTLKKENPNTFSVLAGDLFSPSAVGTARVGDTTLSGKQIVDVFNKMGWDFLTFGNHEFDLNEADFRLRLEEAAFKIFTANVFDVKTGKRFEKTGNSIVLDIEGVSVGIVGVTMTGLKADYVKITDPVEAARTEVTRLRNEKADIVIVVSHLPLEEDIQLTEKVAGIDLIIGGHEHENIHVLRGPDFTPIAKADANAKSAFIHRLTYDTSAKTLNVDSRLRLITDEIREDEEISKIVNKWIDIAFEAFRKDNFEPEKVVCKLTEDLDGLESSVRNKSTRMTEQVANAFFNAFKDVDLSLYNAGSIRIDDVLPAGYEVLVYDVLRIMPFGGTVSKVTMPGSILEKALETGLTNKGSGGFLHYAKVTKTNGTWNVAGKPIEAGKTYTVAIATFLITRGDTNLDFLKTSNSPEIKVPPDEPVDARAALMTELEKAYGSGSSDKAVNGLKNKKVMAKK